MRNVTRFFFHDLFYNNINEFNIAAWEIKKNSYFISNNDNYFTNFNFTNVQISRWEFENAACKRSEPCGHAYHFFLFFA